MLHFHSKYVAKLALCACVVICNAVMCNVVHAGPLGFKDSVMMMGDFSPNWQENFANYAFSPVDAVGVEGLAMRSDDRLLSRQAVQLTYTRRLARWNFPNAQTNVFFIGGVGRVQGTMIADSAALLSPGVQADYETTRLYASAQLRAYRMVGASGAAKPNHDYVAARLGVSFYEVNYEETQPWLVVEARRMRGLSAKTEITPMLRLINKSYFVETGYSNNKEVRFNFMYIF